LDPTIETGRRKRDLSEDFADGARELEGEPGWKVWQQLNLILLSVRKHIPWEYRVHGNVAVREEGMVWVKASGKQQ
jgi:hypothetical protein